MSDRKRISRVFYYHGISFGFLISNFAFAAIEIARNIGSNTNWWTGDFVLALPFAITAYVTLKGVSEQARTSQDIDTERLHRAERAKRARLANALSVISTNADNALSWYHDPYPDIEIDWTEVSRALDTMSNVIEYCDKTTGDQLAQIIAQHQICRVRILDDIQSARIGSSTTNSELNFNSSYFCSNIIRWSVLKIAIENCYKYGRFQADTVPEIYVRQDEIIQKIRFSHRPQSMHEISHPYYGRLQDTVSARFQNGARRLASLI